jgi:uncharacterized protein (TIGR01244 family)
MFRSIDETIAVAGQITPAEIRDAARLGFTAVINNRPDGEEPGQPAGAAIAAAAAEAGMRYHAVPIDHGGFSRAQVEAMRDALAAQAGPVLAFCRSGTRSTFIWALARAADGADGAELRAKAAAAGYDLSPIQPVTG